MVEGVDGGEDEVKVSYKRRRGWRRVLGVKFVMEEEMGGG